MKWNLKTEFEKRNLKWDLIIESETELEKDSFRKVFDEKKLIFPLNLFVLSIKPLLIFQRIGKIQFVKAIIAKFSRKFPENRMHSVLLEERDRVELFDQELFDQELVDISGQTSRLLLDDVLVLPSW